MLCSLPCGRHAEAHAEGCCADATPSVRLLQMMTHVRHPHLPGSAFLSSRLQRGPFLPGVLSHCCKKKEKYLPGVSEVTSDSEVPHEDAS